MTQPHISVSENRRSAVRRDASPIPSVRAKRITNLAAMASNVMLPRDKTHLHTVRYVAQIDLDGWMLRRTKVGAKTNFFVVLEGTTLKIFKDKSAPQRYSVSVREFPPYVDLEKCELHVKFPGPTRGKERVLRLIIPTQMDAREWKHALESAVNSEITDFYKLDKTLGSGAYGEVVQAFDNRTNDKRAIKIIQRGNNMKGREHLDCEIQVMKTIAHDNIVKTYQIFDLKRTIYIVMEHVPGGDLFDFVAQHNCLTESQASQCVRSIFQAVEYLHRHGIVHRDLKPENILCANKSWPLKVKVTDFGFANFMDPNSDPGNTMRTQVGTAYFMAPEIIRNMGHGPAVDLWACGVILYTILTGRLPFPGKNTREYFHNVDEGAPLFPAILWKGISADAMSLVKGLLNKDPNKRLTSLAALQHRYISSDKTPYADNAIRRDRSNLHSSRRKLYKARKVIIAVAMANKFRATIPQVVDKVGDGTKKVAVGIEKGIKKTSEGIGEGAKKTAEGVKKVGDGIGEGTKKIAGGVGTGVKKAVDGVETGAKKVGEGTKKVAGGIETGFKKTAGGIETGFKKTAGGIETGFKKTGEGMKKTGGGIKRGVEKVKLDRERSRGGETGRRQAGAGGSQTGSGHDSVRDGRRRPLFRRRDQSTSISSAVSEQELPGNGDTFLDSLGIQKPSPESHPAVHLSVPPQEPPPVTSARRRSESESSSADYYSANDHDGDIEAEWAHNNDEDNKGLDFRVASAVTSKVLSTPREPMDVDSDAPNGYPDFDRKPLPIVSNSILKHFSDASSSSTGSSRPKLPPLDGLTMGLSDECMAGSSRDALNAPRMDEVEEKGPWDETPEVSPDAVSSARDTVPIHEADALRKAAALLLASMPSNGMMLGAEHMTH